MSEPGLTNIDEGESLPSKVDKLIAAVGLFQTFLSTTQRNAQRTRILSYVVGAIAIASLIIGGVAWHAQSEVQHGQVQNCRNSNATREGQRLLWQTFIGLLVQNGDAHTKANGAAFVAWTNLVFQEHDCSNLSKQYPLPPVPSIDTSE